LHDERTEEAVFDYIKILQAGARSAMTERQFFELEIQNWKKSKARAEQLAGEDYHQGRHDILKRKRTVIGKDGLLQEVENLPNNRLVDNQYAKMVDQKTNYLLGKPLTFDTDNDAYEAVLRKIFNRKFHRTLQNVGEDSLNGGIAWLYVYYDENGEFGFKRFEPFECLPFWKDAEHTVLDAFVRVYTVEVYEGTVLKAVEKVEVYKDSGVERYVLTSGNTLIDDVENPSSDYMTAEDGKGYNWGKIPIVPFKYNNKEIPLIRKVKSLQDAINATLSDFENTMQEDSRNTVLVIKNYDGQNLAEFRYNLATFGAVKVKTIDGAEGAVDTLQVEVNSENYKTLLEILKKSLIENAMGYDAKDERMSGTPNQMNIQSMYSDVDLDANGMETEWQASFEELLWFVHAHLANSGEGDFSTAETEIVFNRDMIFNETDVMTVLYQGGLQISNETLLGQVPFIDDVKKELLRVKTEKQEAIDEYATAFPKQNQPFGGDERDDGA
jgi:SPP1 family phage portal protein